MEKFIDRLDQFMSKEGLNDNQMTVNAGLSIGLINKCRKNGSGMASDSIEKILRAYPRLSAGWLITGEGEMINESVPTPGEKQLPLIPIEAMAGYGTPVYNDIQVEEYYSIGEFKDCDFLLRVKGDSMVPHYNGGDIIACKQVNETLFFQWGRVYAIYTKSQGVMIKRIMPSELNDYIKCVSDNTKYIPFDVPKSDIVALALVKGSISLE